MNIPSATELDGCVNKHISDICGSSYVDDSDNHRAHFVCHATELTFGLNCFGMTGKSSKTVSGNIRVGDVYRNRLRLCGKISA